MRKNYPPRSEAFLGHSDTTLKLCVGRTIPFTPTCLSGRQVVILSGAHLPAGQAGRNEEPLYTYTGVCIGRFFTACLSGRRAFRMTIVLLCIGVFLFIPLLGGLPAVASAKAGVRSGFSFAPSTTAIDSLLKLLHTIKEDTNKVKILNELCKEHLNKDQDKALEYSEQGLALAEKINFKKGIALSLNNIGIVYSGQGNYDKSLNYYLKSLKIREQLENKKGIASTLISIGVIYRHQGNYQKALSFFHKSLKISEALGYKKLISTAIGNLGVIYELKSNYEKALECYLRCLKLSEDVSDQINIRNYLITVGSIYYVLENYEKALEYYNKALNNNAVKANTRTVIICLIGLENTYTALKKHETALKYRIQTQKIEEEIPTNFEKADAFNYIGTLYFHNGNYKQSLEYYLKSLKMALDVNNKNLLYNIYGSLSETYALAAQGGSALSEEYNFKKAYEAHQLYTDIKDSLFNEESSRQIAEMQEKYESEKRKKEIELLNKEKALQNTELNKQKVIIWSGGGGLLLVIALVFFINRGYRQKQRANVLLAAQKQVIETKNKDIIDSIRYAEQIQHAILPLIKEIKKGLPDSFVLFKPKDIVSGDFYWFTEKVKSANKLHTREQSAIGSKSNTKHDPIIPQATLSNKKSETITSTQDKLIFIAACDCTGHGVPGAFMSMIGFSLLREVVNEKGITKPNEILNEVRKGIIASLKQKGESIEQKDGMDAALCSINLENMKLEYAGAYNPLYLIRKGELQQIKADNQPVGYYEGNESPFTNHEIQLQKGDSFYLFSDGYKDQFGGPRGKKFMSKRFRQVFLDCWEMSMDEQKIHLDKTIEDWQGKTEQVDDILVIGVRV